MNRTLLVISIVGTIVLVAPLDFWTSAEFVGSILFILPLILCAMRASTQVLWGTATVAVILTVTAEFWGFNRVALQDPWIGLANRCLLIASLLTLTTFIHLGIAHRQKILLHA